MEVLEDLTALFEKLRDETGGKNISKDQINKICSLYLYEN